MRRTTLSVLSSLAILLSGMIVPEAAAQSRRDKEQTYVLEKPYEVKKLVPPTGKKIKNVILMIGDGMSLMHMYSAWTANRGKLWLDNSQYTGLSKTYCANRLITDSGAGGTALATGHKTNYHMVGVDPAGKPLESLATLANKKGLSPMGRYARRLLLPQYGSRRRGRDRSGLRELWRRLRIRRRLQAIREPCGRSRFVQGIKGERLPDSP